MRAAVPVGLALAALASPALADSAGDGGAVQDVLVTVLALGVVCALAYVALHVLKRLQAVGSPSTSATADELRFVRALPVGSRERLVVVRWRGRTLLLGVTAGAISVLDQEPADAAPDGTVSGLEPADLTRTLLARVFARRPRENPS